MEDDPVGFKDFQLPGHEARMAKLLVGYLSLTAQGDEVEPPSDFPSGYMVIAGDFYGFDPAPALMDEHDFVEVPRVTANPFSGEDRHGK